MELDRRRFLAAGLASPWLVAGNASAAQQEARPPASENTLDLHIHLFGIGDAGSGCRLSERIREGLLFQMLEWKLGIRKQAKTGDQGYERVLAELLEKSGVERGLILAQDAVYGPNGKPDWERTHFYVPNDYLLDVVGRHSARMLPCVSINPDRADAIDELERCVERGAPALKIHPPTQGVDLADKKHATFFRRCAELGIVVMVHTGHEHSAPIVDAQLARPGKLELALTQGCTVVACHCGTGWPGEKPDMLPEFLAMVRKYPRLWGDTAILGTAARVIDVLRLMDDEAAVSRLLHGSDFPFPSQPLAFATKIGLKKAYRLQRTTNPIQQDLALKEALGFGLASARRAHDLIR
jgi:predicted TIM-barrel fold metal-dependent hydrolase